MDRVVNKNQPTIERQTYKGYEYSVWQSVDGWLAQFAKIVFPPQDTVGDANAIVQRYIDSILAKKNSQN